MRQLKHTTPILALLLALAIPPAAQAQTPTTTVKDAGGTTVFQSFAEGQLYAPGPFGSGTIPTEGAGTRLMWWPKKAAFRAGRVYNDDSDPFRPGVDGRTFWNASNVGTYSVAFGSNTKASGEAATATGTATSASGKNATAMGDGTTASGENATAMGKGTRASGEQAVAMNSGTEASGRSAVAMNNADAGGNLSTAMGRFTDAKGFGTVTMGDRTVAATRSSVTAGRCNDANRSSGSYLFVFGNGPIDSSTGFCNNRSDALVLRSSGDLTISGTLTENSDRRLKTRIESLDDGVLGKLADVRPVRFEFKNQQTHPAGTQLGLIAQDVRTEFPALVSEGADGMLSLSYSKFTAVLLKGLQEQQAQIEKKESRLDRQQEQIAGLTSENEEIKKRVAALERSSRSPATAGWVGGWSGTAFAFLLGAGLLWRPRS